MHNRFSRTLTALVVVFGLWAGSLTALASTLPAQQAGQQQAPAKQGSGDRKAAQGQTGGDEAAAQDSQAQPAPSDSNPQAVARACGRVGRRRAHGREGSAEEVRLPSGRRLTTRNFWRHT